MQHLFENPAIQASEITLDPGQRYAPRDPGEGGQMLYPLRNCKVRLRLPDGKSWDVGALYGEPIWTDSAPTSIESIGLGRCDLLSVHVKNGRPTPTGVTTGPAPAGAPSGEPQTSGPIGPASPESVNAPGVK